MIGSDERILTTHVGSLPRTDELIQLIHRRGQDETVDQTELDSAIAEATERAIQRQAEVGIDIGNDGEQSRPGFHIYVSDRLEGFSEQTIPRPRWADVEDFPTYAGKAFPDIVSEAQTRPVAVEEVRYGDGSIVEREIERCREIRDRTGVQFEGTFMTAASPGVIASSLGNQYYDSNDEFTFALAREMRKEYERIADAGMILQIDAPDVLSERHRKFKNQSIDEFKTRVRQRIKAINEATQGIPAKQIRLHCCWGNYEGPHHRDVPLEEILPLLYEANVGGLLIEYANPRHHHEWRAFAEHPLPDDWQLIPGVVDVKTNIIEHPQTVADRIGTLAEVVGDPTRILAAPDCGLATLAGHHTVDPEIAWAKLETLSKGAERASKDLLS
ncbi:cobalamin-independent methionine synthase II family protein [Halobellus limi]|uniref:5-methyltetrahydropteroyltriglutamate--homocysteine methyltransferase n=1 Tax=Halobellus limi TaxID=699433 RepID=A0A1H6BWR6_9EURY|nr:cobalamin-independent methionine synthase II family protein [Halobellus limi]QCC49449.1 methionine synthase [Halobellus limi]SEG64616.1 5-methyltetrahydropteroyltriglutamate--homocysteine methyltransferase [Halobellus limi]